jgi:hypothetical protein
MQTVGGPIVYNISWAPGNNTQMGTTVIGDFVQFVSVLDLVVWLLYWHGEI